MSETLGLFKQSLSHLQTLKILTMENIIQFDLNKMGYQDIYSMHLVINAYVDLDKCEDIFETGFNTSSGYVYIALENGIQIVSCFASDVQYIVTDMETGEEFFLDSYIEAEKKQHELVD